MWQLPPLQPEEILIYLRKSRTDDPLLSVEEVLSKHEQMLNEWVERNLPGLGPVPERNRYREVVSGETIASRPRVQEMLRQVEHPQYKAVLIVDPQRLSRGDLEDIGRMVKLLRYSNTIVITLPYSYDLRDERDRDAFERELKRGNEFLEYQKKIMNNGRLLAVENGWFIGNKPPYGFDIVAVKDGKRTCYTLAPNPVQAPVVKKAFELFAKGYSCGQVARTLNDMGAPTAKGGKWHRETLSKMRTNLHYIGKVYWNRRQTVKTVEDGEVVESRPVNADFLVFPGRHEAMIDMETWNAVQEHRDKIPPVKERAKCVNPLAGLAFCKCGRVMNRRAYIRKGVERSAPRLLCPAQTECGTPSSTMDDVLAQVAAVLRECIADIELKIENSSTDSVELHAQLIAQMEKRLADLDKLELSQWDKYTQEGMPKHIFDQLNAKVLQEKAEVQQALFVARDTLPEPVDYVQKKAMFSDALAALLDPDAPAREQNILLKKCIDRIDYKREPIASTNRRQGTGGPIELEIHLRV